MYNKGIKVMKTGTFVAVSQETQYAQYKREYESTGKSVSKLRELGSRMENDQNLKVIANPVLDVKFWALKNNVRMKIRALGIVPGNIFIPHDNSWCIDLETRAEASIVQPCGLGWLDRGAVPDKGEVGAVYTVLGPAYELVVPGNLKKHIWFVDVQSSLSGRKFRVIV